MAWGRRWGRSVPAKRADGEQTVRNWRPAAGEAAPGLGVLATLGTASGGVASRGISAAERLRRGGGTDQMPRPLRAVSRTGRNGTNRPCPAAGATSSGPPLGPGVLVTLGTASEGVSPRGVPAAERPRRGRGTARCPDCCAPCPGAGWDKPRLPRRRNGLEQPSARSQ